MSEIVVPMQRRAELHERRTGRRFEVDWPVVLKSQNGNFEADGRLQNIGARGALVLVQKGLPVGKRVSVAIRTPARKVQWMDYSARILRVEYEAQGAKVALKFLSLRPVFRHSAEPS